MNYDLQSSVLIITDHKADDLTIGAEITSNLKLVFPLVVNKFETIIIDSDLFKFKDLQRLLKNIETQSPYTQKIISISSLNSKQILQLINQFEIFKILKTWDSKQLEMIILESKEEFYRLKQHEDLIELYNEQNNKLQNSKILLEDRIKKRQESLESIKQRAVNSNKQLSKLVKTIVQIQTADCLEDIEIGITQMLSSFMQLQKTQIILNSSKSKLSKELKKDQYIFELELEPNLLGHILYQKQGIFISSEKKLLRQISEAVALTINKILARQKTEILREQWESTFHSIAYPIAIIDKNFNLLQFNKKISSINQKKCFQVLFDRKSPCINCQMKKSEGSFKIANSNRHVEVLSRKFSDTSYVNVYKDITEEILLEKQILEKAKVSELGIIGSSIAHELNNPLSGIIALLQIIADELPKSSKYKDDILQMQDAAENCRKIINNLLSFSRMSPLAQHSSVDIRDLIYKSIHLAELKTKSRGIHIEVTAKGKHHVLILQAEVIQQVLTKFINSIIDATIKNIETDFNKILQTKKDSKDIPRIFISLGFEDSFYKIIADVFLTENQPLFSDINSISSLMTFLGGSLKFTPYDGKKAQAQLIIPFTKES